MTIDDLIAARDNLILQLGSPQHVSTPQLGDVMFRSSVDVLEGLAVLNSAISAMQGARPVSTFVAVSDRGLGGNCK